MIDEQKEKKYYWNWIQSDGFSAKSSHSKKKTKKIITNHSNGYDERLYFVWLYLWLTNEIQIKHSVQLKAAKSKSLTTGQMRNEQSKVFFFGLLLLLPPPIEGYVRFDFDCVCVCVCEWLFKLVIVCREQNKTVKMLQILTLFTGYIQSDETLTRLDAWL